MNHEELCLVWVDDWTDEEFREFLDYMRGMFRARFHHSIIDDNY